MKTTLNDLLKRFDEEYYAGELAKGSDMKHFLIESIKDALEAVRVEKQNLEPYYDDRADGWDMNTTQYDENVATFLGEK